MKPFHEQTLRAKFNGGNVVILDESGTIIASGVSKEAQAALLLYPDAIQTLELLSRAFPVCATSEESDAMDAARVVLRKAGVIGGGES